MPSTTPLFNTVTPGGGSSVRAGARSAAAAFGSVGAGADDRRPARRGGGTSAARSPALGRSGLGQVSSKLAGDVSPVSVTGGAAGGCARKLTEAGSTGRGDRSRSFRTVDWNRR